MSETVNFSLVISNLIVLILVGLLGSGWVLYYTDTFPVVGGLLGLGGFFAWIAFVINILSEDRKKQLQEWFDGRFLQKHWLWISLVTLLIVGLGLLAPMRGTLILDSLEAPTGHLVEVSNIEENKPEMGTPPRRVILAPRSSAKILLPTGWFGSGKYYVKVSGLPACRVEVKWLSRERLLIPDMLFERPVLLARPSAKLSGPVSEGFSLEVIMDDNKIGAIAEYRGEAVWIGADEDVKVPDKLVADWRIEFRDLDEKGISLWLHPASLASTLEIPSSAKVTVRLISREDQKIRYSKDHLISKSGKARQFPEEIVLDEH